MTRVTMITLLLLGLAAQAQEKLELKASHREGEAVDVAYRMHMKMEGTFQGQALSASNTGRKEYRDEILTVKDGKVTRLRRTYRVHEQRSEQQMTGMPPQSSEEKNLIVGQTVTLVSKDGEVEIEGDRPATGELNEDDLDMSDDTEVFLPGEAVAVGASWDVPEEELKRMLGSDGPDRATANCTLSEVTEETATIRLRLTMEEDAEGGKMTATIEGPIMFDRRLGKIVSIRAVGTIKMVTPMAALEGPMEMEFSAKPAK